MLTDYERRLTATLRTLTPEPPHPALTHHPAAMDDAALDLVSAATVSRRSHRAAIALSAAAVVLISAGMARYSTTRHAQSAKHDAAASLRSKGAAGGTSTALCPATALRVTRTPFVATPGGGTMMITLTNVSASTCRLSDTPPGTLDTTTSAKPSTRPVDLDARQSAEFIVTFAVKSTGCPHPSTHPSTGPPRAVMIVQFRPADAIFVPIVSTCALHVESLSFTGVR